jgi:hypothetical protein
MTQERAVLAGGRFWGMQDLIRRHDDGSCPPAAAQIAVHCTRDKVIWKSQGPDRARPIPR